MNQYFPKPYTVFEGNVNVTVDLSKYTTKADFKDAAGTGTSNFALK